MMRCWCIMETKIALICKNNDRALNSVSFTLCDYCLGFNLYCSSFKNRLKVSQNSAIRGVIGRPILETQSVTLYYSKFFILKLQ